MRCFTLTQYLAQLRSYNGVEQGRLLLSGFEQKSRCARQLPGVCAKMISLHAAHDNRHSPAPDDGLNRHSLLFMSVCCAVGVP